MPTTRTARERRQVKHDDEPHAEGQENERDDDGQDEYEDEVDEEDEGYDQDEAEDEGEGYDEDEPHAENDDDGQITTASAAAKSAVDQITELIAKQPEGVIGVEPGDDGWRVSVEVIEDRRIPSSADILAIYEVAIARSGDLTSYRRISRYGRGHGDGGYDQ